MTKYRVVIDLKCAYTEPAQREPDGRGSSLFGRGENHAKTTGCCALRID